MPNQYLNLSEEDLQLRYQLAEKRLICEVPFDRDLIETLREGLFLNHERAWDFPYLAAVVTVGTGIYWYQSGDLWDSFPRLETSSERMKWGRQFEEFLEDHPTLETFSFLREEGHRYVAPILAHGGVPHSCLENLFEILCKRCSYDQTGTEALEYFEGNSRALSGGNRPVRRFLSFGGEPAEDLVGRLFVLWRVLERGDDVKGSGLPKRIVAAFSEWYGKAAPRLQTRRRRRFPNPTIHLDPRLMTIGLSLPACTGHPDAGDFWQVADRKIPSDVPHVIAIGPEPRWDVSSGRRSFGFVGVGDGSDVMFFDPSNGHLVRDAERRRLPEQVWAIIREGVSTAPEPTHCEPFYPWHGYSICAFHLDGMKRLQVGDASFEIRRPFFKINDQQPVVANAVSSTSGAPVFSAAPDVHWEGPADLNVAKDGVDQGSMEITPGDLKQLVDSPGEYRIELRGPLGQNYGLDLLLVPGLEVRVQPSLKLPGTRIVTWSVSAPDATITQGQEAGTSFSSTKNSIGIEVLLDDHEMAVELTVPEVGWCVTRDPEYGSEGWTSEPLRIEVMSLTSDVTLPLFVCRYPGGSDNTNMSLRAHRGGLELSPRRISVEGEAYWHFRLDEVRDALIATGKSERFNLDIKSGESSAPVFDGPVLEIRPEWDIQVLSADWTLVDGGYAIEVSWQEHGGEVEGRWLVVQPIWRPWDNPSITCEVSARDRGSLQWELNEGQIRPGRYVVRAVHAPWGLADASDVVPVQECYVDFHPEIWGDFFDCSESPPSLEFFFEALLAHCYRPERVAAPSNVPQGVDASEIIHFLEWVEAAAVFEQATVRTMNHAALKFFCLNADATAEAVANLEELPPICALVLPPLDILRLSPTKADRDFLFNVMLNYRGLESSRLAASVASDHRPGSLSDPLKGWHRGLRGTRGQAHKVPPLGQLIYLCERFRIMDGRSPQAQEEYLQLRRSVKGWEP